MTSVDGRTQLIDIATKQDGRTVGHGVQSMTDSMRAVRYKPPEGDRDIVLIDTPGFDDTYKSDIVILKGIADYLVYL